MNALDNVVVVDISVNIVVAVDNLILMYLRLTTRSPSLSLLLVVLCYVESGVGVECWVLIQKMS